MWGVGPALGECRGGPRAVAVQEDFPSHRGVRGELARLGRRPRKRFGQHFLTDAHAVQRIVDLAQLDGTQRVLEIGPGLGALTEGLRTRARELWLVEIDADLAERLREEYANHPEVHVLQADVLRLDLVAVLGAPPGTVVVGNLPYNIATAVLTTLLEAPGHFPRMVLMLQREVVDRLCAAPGSKAYGSLSVYTQFAARVRPALRVAPGAFVPRPLVESEVVVIEPYAAPPVAVRDPVLFQRLVRTVFGQRRKQLANSMRPLCADAVRVLDAAGIAPRRRPETLSLAEFAALANALADNA